MKNWKLLLGAGWGIYALSFFLPVHRYGETLASGTVPGVEALFTALMEGGTLGIASALTNVIMIATLVAFSMKLHALFKVILPLMVIALVLNLSWLWTVDHVSDLRVGFYLWFLSFGIVTLAWMQFLKSSEEMTHRSLA